MNEQRIAVALEYDGDHAPRVTATGHHDVADKIIALAMQHGVPLQQDKELVEILAQLPTGEEIPEELYRAVAEVIAFAYVLTGKFPKHWNDQTSTQKL
jgi:flagellar biosynthesis protein